MEIHEDLVIAPTEPVPPDARFKGYRDVVIQGLVIKTHNIRYRLACWQTNNGKYLTGRLPVALQGHHFDPTLRSYIIYQHHHCHVTQPLLLEQLREWGIDISCGQIDAILRTHSQTDPRQRSAASSHCAGAGTGMDSVCRAEGLQDATHARSSRTVGTSL